MKRLLLHSRWAQLLVAVLVLMSCGVGLVSILSRSREGARRFSCQSNLKGMALGIAQYRLDYDGRFPLKRVHSAQQVRVGRKHIDDYTIAYGWADAHYPYTRSSTNYTCVSEITFQYQFDATLPDFSDYWMNENLFGRHDKTLAAPQAVLLTGEGESSEDSTAQYSKKAISSLPLAKTLPEGYSQGPCFERHLGRANYAFADGHVKWLAKEEISTAPNQPYTFAPH